MSALTLRAYDRAAVVIPACDERTDERAALPGCLRTVVTAALCAPIPVTVVVVLDAGDDASTQLAGQFGSDVHFVSVDAGNLGAARAAGFGYARSLCGPECWYATTGVGSRVDPDWLVHQLAVDADMVLDAVHANMGFSARAYWRVGGFRALPSGADADLVARFEDAGYCIHRDAEVPAVRTPASDEVVDYLRRLAAPAAEDCA